MAASRISCFIPTTEAPSSSIVAWTVELFYDFVFFFFLKLISWGGVVKIAAAFGSTGGQKFSAMAYQRPRGVLSFRPKEIGGGGRDWVSTISQLCRVFYSLKNHIIWDAWFRGPRWRQASPGFLSGSCCKLSIYTWGHPRRWGSKLKRQADKMRRSWRSGPS